MSETALSRAIQDSLISAGVWVERIQSGQHRVRGGVLHCASPGTPDLFLPALNVWLEVKTESGRLKASQIAWHARAKATGVRVVVVRSVREALAAVVDVSAEKARRE